MIFHLKKKQRRLFPFPCWFETLIPVMHAISEKNDHWCLVKHAVSSFRRIWVFLMPLVKLLFILCIAGKFFLYLVFMFLTFTYFTFYGMMAVGLTPNQQLAAVVSSAFYSLWNLLSGFLIPKPVSNKIIFFLFIHQLVSWEPRLNQQLFQETSRPASRS